MREIDKTIILMASKIIGTLNVFVLSIFFARMLLKADYGTYIQVNMIVGLLVMVLSLGIPPSMFYFLPKENNQKHLIKRTYILLFFMGCLICISLFFLRDLIAQFMNNDELSQYVVLAGICIVCRMCSNLTQPIMLVLKESVVLAGINVFNGLLFFSTMVTCLFTGSGIKIIIYVFTANNVVNFFVALYIIVKYSKKFTDNYKDVIVPLRSQFKFAIPLALSGVLWLLGREIDKYIIAHYLNPGDLAVYARGAVEIPLVQIFAATIAQVYLPNWVTLFDKKDYGALIANWHVTITKTALIMFPVFVMFQIIGYDFIVLMYSEEYAGSVPIFMIYLFLVPLQLTEYTAVVESSGKTILISLGYVIQISLNIVFSIILLKKLGSIGPALVTILSMYFWVSYMLFIISRICKVPMTGVFPWLKLLRLMMICLGAGVIPYGLKVWLDQLGVFNHLVNPELIFFTRIAFVCIIYAAVYMAMLFITKTLDEDDRATLYRWLLIGKIKRVFGKSA